jgi:hypothetical protein
VKKPPGVRWLRGRSTLHRKVWVYDGQVIDRDTKQIWVYDVEPRWKTEYSHWINDYLLYPQEPMRLFAPKLL